MKQYPEETGGTTDGGTVADASAAGTTPSGTTPAAAAKTYTDAEVASYVRQAHADRDGAWNKHLFDSEKGKDALTKLAAHHGVKLTEAEKENVADAAATGDDSELTPREKAMLARLDTLENADKTKKQEAAEQRATEAMQADISRATHSVPYGRDPELTDLVKDLILASMIDPKTPKGTPAQKLALGIQTGLERVFAGWAKRNGYVKDPNAALNEPLRGGATTTNIGPGPEPKSYADMEEQTSAMIRAMRMRK